MTFEKGWMLYIVDEIQYSREAKHFIKNQQFPSTIATIISKFVFGFNLLYIKNIFDPLPSATRFVHEDNVTQLKSTKCG